MVQGAVSRWIISVVLSLCAMCSNTLAYAQQPFHEKVVDEFVDKTLPTLRAYTKEELKLHTIMKDLKERSDLVAFAYMMAVSRLREPMNTWNDAVKRETGFWIYILCPIAKYLGLPPKEKKQQEEMEKVRRAIYEGSFELSIARLSFRKDFLETNYTRVEKEKRLPVVDQLVNPKWLTREQLEKARKNLE